AVPPDYDDDDGGAVRHAADRAGLRRGRRCAAAAGPGGGRWAGGESVPDAVHYAGDLPVSGWAPGVAAGGGEGGREGSGAGLTRATGVKHRASSAIGRAGDLRDGCRLFWTGREAYPTVLADAAAVKRLEKVLEA